MRTSLFGIICIIGFVLIVALTWLACRFYIINATII